MRLWRVAPLLFAALMAACDDPAKDEVNVKIVFVEADPAKRLSKVAVISGGEKSYWSELGAGKAESATLKPRPTEGTQLTVQFELDGQRKSWQGPRFPAGTGYKIEVRVDGRGDVTERHCRIPCNLD